MRRNGLFILALMLAVSTIATVFAKDRNREGQNFKWVPKSGDLVFQTTKSQLGPALELATGSNLTHVGIVYREADTMFVLEAAGSVRRIPLDRWVKNGVEEKIYVKRFKSGKALLTAEVMDKIKRTFEKFEGREYDIQFGWSDDKFYCSELVYKIFKEAAGIELGEIQKYGDFHLDNEIVRFWVNMYNPDGINVDENVITPVSIYNDSSLVTVYSTY